MITSFDILSSIVSCVRDIDNSIFGQILIIALLCYLLYTAPANGGTKRIHFSFTAKN